MPPALPEEQEAVASVAAQAQYANTAASPAHSLDAASTTAVANLESAASREVPLMRSPVAKVGNFRGLALFALLRITSAIVSDLESWQGFGLCCGHSQAASLMGADNAIGAAASLEFVHFRRELAGGVPRQAPAPGGS